MSQVIEHNGVRPGDEDQPHEEPVVLEDPFLKERQQQLKVAVGGGAVAALVAYLLWRLKLRRTPQTPTERLTDAARALGDASVAFGGRAAGRVADTAVPAAKGVADAAVPAGQRLVEATKHLGGASVSAGERALDRLGDVAGPVAGSASDIATKAAGVAQSVGSGIAEVPDVVTDAAQGVHKFWRKWTLRILMLLAAGIGYTAGAAAGRERYDQIVGAAKTVAERPEVQSAQQKLVDAVTPDHGNPTV